MTGENLERNDFYEEDEPIEKIWASWAEGEYGLTAPPRVDWQSPTEGNMPRLWTTPESFDGNGTTP